MPHRVLLISTNLCSVPDPVFPLGLAHLSGALRQAGHETRWHDLQVSGPGFEQVLESFRPTLVGVSVRNIDDVLIRKRETYFGGLQELVRTIKAVAACPTVLGGSGFSIFPEELLRFSEADYGIAGAGEGPLLALMSALDAGQGFDDVPGLVHRRNGHVLRNPSQPDLRSDTSPVERPADIVAHYLRAGGMLNVQTQRGCAWHCCYCTYPLIEGRAHRRHSPEAVADEFERVQHAGGRYVFIVDSVFNSSPRHVTEICECLLRRNLKLSWGCFLRPQGLSSELMRLMARAGLKHVEFGSDSFCDEVLSAYHKGLTFDDIRLSSELASREHIDFCHFLIAGGPGETMATLRQTYGNSKLIANGVFMAVVGMRIYPGTELFQRAVSEGLVSASTDLLQPVYYLAPSLTTDSVFAELQAFATRSPSWIVGDPTPGYARFVERLRQRGVVGPLWSYVPYVQRIWPANLGQLPASDSQLTR